MDLSFIFYNAFNTIVADAPATFGIVVAVCTIMVALLYIMKDKYSKLRVKHNQQVANKKGLDVLVA